MQDGEYLVVDIEGTCCEDDSIPSSERETIEIGAVIVSTSGNIIKKFSMVIRPVLHPNLTTFCIGLTGIQQKEVDSARLFSEVWENEFLPWTEGRKGFCSWGKYDLNQLGQDCKRNNLSFQFKQHGDLCAAFGRRCGNRKAMRLLGLSPQGNQHRGLDDAVNIATILKTMLINGKVVIMKDI